MKKNDNSYKDTQQTETVIDPLAHISSSAFEISKTLEGETDFDIIKAAHDWIIINTIYDLTQPTSSIPPESFTSKGVFENGLAVCQGYALALEELLDAKGIESKVVYGHADGISHAWNIVNLDNNWYHIDATWDDPIINGENGVETSNLSYDYFLVTDQVISQSHTSSYVINNQGNKEENIPIANSERFLFIPKSYDIDASLVLTSLSEMSEAYYNLLINGSSSVTFFYPEEELFSMTNISDLQYYVATKEGRCSGFTINESGLVLSGYKYFSLIPTQ